MTDKVRQVSERSLENLKLGSKSRDKGKQRHNFTVLPETVQWLKDTGNASDAIDKLVEVARKGESLSNTEYQQKIKDLERDLEETYLELSKVRSQLLETQGDVNSNLADDAKSISVTLRGVINYLENVAETGRLTQRLRDGLKPESIYPLELLIKKLKVYYN
jgi:DNA-binding transcriptional regulator GbsR (MarR family)